MDGGSSPGRVRALARCRRRHPVRAGEGSRRRMADRSRRRRAEGGGIARDPHRRRDPGHAGWSSTRGGHNLFVADGERLLELLQAAGAKEGKGRRSESGSSPSCRTWRSASAGTSRTGGQASAIRRPSDPRHGRKAAAMDEPTKGEGCRRHAPGSRLCLPGISGRKEGDRREGNGKANGKAPDAKANGKAPRRNGTDVEARATKYLDKCEGAVSGTRAQQDIRRGLPGRPRFRPRSRRRIPADPGPLQPACEPPWSETELRHKVEDAYKEEKGRGWLLDGPAKKGRKGGPPSSNGDGQRGEPDERPSIENNTECIVVKDAIKALLRDRHLFRGGTCSGP